MIVYAVWLLMLHRTASFASFEVFAQSIADGEEILPTYGGHDARVRKLQAASFLPLFFSVRLEPTQITQKPTNPPKPHE